MRRRGLTPAQSTCQLLAPPPRAPATGHEAVQHLCAGGTGGWGEGPGAGGRGGVFVPIRHWRRTGRFPESVTHAPRPALRSKWTRRGHNSTRSTGSATLAFAELRRPLRVTEAGPRDQLAPGAAAACNGALAGQRSGGAGGRLESDLTPTGLQGEGSNPAWPATTVPPGLWHVFLLVSCLHLSPSVHS